MGNEILPPPTCLESERAVVASILAQPGDSKLDMVVGTLTPEDFYDPSCKACYRAIAELHAARLPVDIPAIKDWLNQHKQNRMVDAETIQRSLQLTPYVSDVAPHVAQVRRFSKLRRLIGTCQDIAAKGRESLDNVDAFIEEAEAAVYRVAATGDSEKAVHTLKDCIRELFVRMQDEIRARGEGRVLAASTGLTGLDRLIGGLRPGTLTVIAARPSMGKTALLLNLATHAAGADATPRLGAHVISLESHRLNVAARMLSAHGDYNIEKLTQSRIDNGDWPALTAACGSLSKVPITIDDRSGLTLSQIRASIRRAQAELRRTDGAGNVSQKLGLVCVDYLQLCKNPIRNGTREQEVAGIAYGLLEMASEFEVPIVALSQLSRAVESRTDKRPTMADIRESGAIEQAATVIIALYRDDYYNRDSEDTGIAEAIVLKSKDTKTGMVKIRFRPEWMKFYDLETENYDA